MTDLIKNSVMGKYIFGIIVCIIIILFIRDFLKDFKREDMSTGYFIVRYVSAITFLSIVVYAYLTKFNLI